MRLPFLILALMAGVTAGPAAEKGNDGYTVLRQEDGPVLSYSGVPLLRQDGKTFKDHNRNGRLDPYEDWRLPDSLRAADLAKRLGNEEIAGLMLHSSHQGIKGMAVPQGMLRERHVRSLLIREISSVEDAVRWNNAAQAFAESLPHGIPLSLSSDPRHSTKSDDEFNAGGTLVSAWPSQMGLAASFDPSLSRRFAGIAASEYRALGLSTTLSPQTDLTTEPRWKRSYMCFSEHPGLSADCTAAYIEGFQPMVNCMVKHWPGGGTGEGGRDAHFAFGKYAVYPGGLFRTQLYPFTQGAFRSGVAAVMPYYTISSGIDPSGKNVGNSFSEYIVGDLLRKECGYDGIVCTDWRILEDCTSTGLNSGKPWGVENLTMGERAYACIKAGVDQFGGLDDPAPVLEAWRLGAGEFGEAAMRERFERSARRILTAFFRTGLFENPYLDMRESLRIVGNRGYMAEGFEAQKKSIVLLKNHGAVLPLDRKKKVYVHKRHFPASESWWTEEKNDDAHDGYAVDLKMLKEYVTVVDDPARADCEIVFVKGPSVQRGYSLKDGYRPISLQYGDYKTARTDNYYEADAVREARNRMGERPVVVCVTCRTAMCFGEIEPSADALLLGFDVQKKAFMELVTGRSEPSALLPVQEPRDMEAVESQKEDVPFDMACYRDGDGNVYDFGFGLGWSGRIRDARTLAYQPLRRQLKVGTYNLFTSTSRRQNIEERDPKKTVSRQRYWCNSGTAVADMIARLNCDVMGLQEVDDSLLGLKGNVKLPEMLSERGCNMDWIIYPNTPEGGHSFCPAILYKRGVVEPLQSGIFWMGGVLDRKARAADAPRKTARQCVWARFRHLFTGKEFYLLSVHTCVPQKIDGKMNFDANIYNMEQVIRYAREFIPEDVPCLAVGDFNAGETNPTWPVILSYRWKDALSDLAARDLLDEDVLQWGTQNVKNEKNLSTWYPDHILYDGFIPRQLLIDRNRFPTADGTLHYPSDHLPVTSVMEFVQ